MKAKFVRLVGVSGLLFLLLIPSLVPTFAATRQQSDLPAGEPNNSFGAATIIAASSVTEGTIAPVGDVDWYALNVEEQGELQITITNVAAELVINVRVWNSDKATVSSWFAPLAAGGDTLATVDLVEPGRYLLEVRDGGDDTESTQPYSLQTEFTPSPVAGEPNNSIGAVTPLAFDTPVQATILPVGDSDWYGITVEGHGELTVAMTNASDNLELSFRVWDGDARDISGWQRPLAAGGDNIAIVDLPTAGRYAIEVRDNGDDARSIAPYTIAASFIVPADTFEPNNSYGATTPLLLGSQVEANILPRGDSDWFRIRVDHHGELQLFISNVSPDLDIAFRVWDANVRDMTSWIRPLAKGGDTTGVVDLPAPGEYTLEVRDGSDDSRSTQPYSLRTIFTKAVDPFEPNNSFGKATFLGINRQTQANILPRGDSDWYALVADTQGQLDVAITSVPTDMDIAFRLWDADARDVSGWFRPLAKGGDTIGSLDIGVPGAYVLEVRDGSDDTRSIDPYDLNIDFTAAADKGEPNNTIDTAASINLDETIVGNVLPAGDADWCIFEILEPGELHVLVTNVAPELDIAFRLWDGEQNVISNWVYPLAAGGNTEAVFPIETAGTYYLELVDNRGDGRSIQPYYLYFSMQPIDPAVVVPAEDATPPTVTTPGGPGSSTTNASPDAGLKIRVSGQAGTQGAELFVREPDDLEVNGARLTIPPGAVDDYVTIHIGTTDQPPINAPYGMFPAGKYWVFDPAGTQFNVPVTLTLPVPPGSATSEVFVGHWDGTQWSSLGGTPDNGLITVETDSFSYFGVFCGAFASYQNVTLRNETSTDFLTITYLSGPQPDPEMLDAAPEGCPAPYSGTRRWELDSGESAHLLLRPGLYQVEVAYPTPQPGVANPLLFRVPPGRGEQTIAIQDSGATSDHADALIIFAGNAATAETNTRPIITCSANVPPGVPLLNADPVAAALPSRVVLIGSGAPVKLEQFPPNGPGIEFTAQATDPEGSQLSTYWTVRRATGSSTTAGSVVASAASIPDESDFTAPNIAGRYTVFLTVYDQFGLFDECRWVIDVVPNAKPQIEVFSGRVHVEFGRLDEDRTDAGLIPPVPSVLRPGVGAPLPVALPNGTSAVWDGLTLCPTALAGPLAALPTLEETVTAPAPVDVMLPPAPIPSNDPNAPAADVTNLWAYPGRTCVWALVADADGDALDVQWEFPGPIFGSGTFYAATAMPAGFHEDAPAGMALGTFLRTYGQLRAYNAWVSFLYNSFGVIPAIVWEAWDDPCPGVEPENPCPSAISRGGVENIVASVSDGFIQPPLYDYTPIEVGPDAVEPNECATVLFFSELRPNPPDPAPFQGVEVHARLSSLTQDCPVRFIVRGTDGYAVDTYIPTNKDGEATIFIPGAREGIVDTIIAEVCRGPLSDLATPPPAAEQCMTQAGEPGWVLRIEVQYIF